MNREAIGLAGEYAVASELCKRGFYAQLTLGNHKKTDILVESSNEIFRVSVKAKTKDQWPKVTGIWQKGDLLVFVDFKRKENHERPDFYVLGVDEWKLVAKKIQKAKGGGAKIDETNTVYWEPWEGNEKGWRGCSVTINDVKKYKDNWPTVET